MGNLESVRLSVGLNQDEYAPGEEVHGLLHVDVSEDVEVSEVSVQLSGEWIQYERKKDRDSRELKSKTLFEPESESIGKIAENTVPAGEYQVPFVLRLPEDLDPSVLIGDGDTVTGVCYNLSVLAHLPEEEEPIVVASKEVEVITGEEEEESAEVEETVVAGVKQLGFSVGHLELSLKLPKRRYRYGDKIQVSYMVKNDSKWDVKYIRVMLETIYRIDDDEKKCSRQQLLQIPDRIEAGEEFEGAGECFLEFETGSIDREDICVVNSISLEPVISHRTVDPLKVGIVAVGRGHEELHRPDMGLTMRTVVYAPIQCRLDNAQELLFE